MTDPVTDPGTDPITNVAEVQPSLMSVADIWEATDSPADRSGRSETINRPSVIKGQPSDVEKTIMDQSKRERHPSD